jgi:hypothetical protein
MTQTTTPTPPVYGHIYIKKPRAERGNLRDHEYIAYDETVARREDRLLELAALVTRRRAVGASTAIARVDLLGGKKIEELARETELLEANAAKAPAAKAAKKTTARVA